MSRLSETSGWGIIASRILLVFGVCLLFMSSVFQAPAAVTSKMSAINDSNSTAIVTDAPDDEIAGSPEFVTSTITAEDEPLPQAADSGEAVSVVEVIDGDTVDVLLNGAVERIRLIGIDTPETLDQRKPVQCFGHEASARTHLLLDGQQVSLESDPQVGNRDKYHRLLRYIFLGDTLINKQLIAEGYAHEYTYLTPYKYQIDFKNTELQSQRAGLGFWSAQSCSGNTTQPAHS